MAEGLQVVSTEALGDNIGMENRLQLAARFVSETIVDSHGGEGMSERPAQALGGLGRVAVGDGAVGVFKECGGFVLVELDGSHWLKVFSLQYGCGQLGRWLICFCGYGFRVQFVGATARERFCELMP